MNKPCQCETVKQYDNSVWQCMICRRRFVPYEKPVEKFETVNLETIAEVWYEPKGTRKCGRS